MNSDIQHVPFGDIPHPPFCGETHGSVIGDSGMPPALGDINNPS